MLGPLFKENYPVSSPYGKRAHPLSGETHFHNGVDYAAPVGTEILSPIDGVISFSGADDRSGVFLGVASKDFTVSFSHLLTPTRFTGDTVTKGEVIALSGDSGNSTGPHVHVRVRNSEGETIDPAPLFRGSNPAFLVLGIAALIGGLQ
jgi:murein DD-endopeptidase MepM/ murein hydrolase activator NlpD